MPRPTLSPVRLALVVLACALPLATAQAQNAPPPPEPATATPEPGRQNQKIENIHSEDSGAAVDEVRYGGRTQSITVTPKNNMPAYEVVPKDGQRAPQGQPGQSDNGSGTGSRVWNVFKF